MGPELWTLAHQRPPYLCVWHHFKPQSPIVTIALNNLHGGTPTHRGGDPPSSLWVHYTHTHTHTHTYKLPPARL